MRASGKLPETLRQNVRILCIENHPKITGKEQGWFLGNMSEWLVSVDSLRGKHRTFRYRHNREKGG